MSLDNPQNAEEYLLSAFLYVHGAGTLSDTRATVREALNRHAHELAEQIRNSTALRDPTDDHMGDVNAAADLIDPSP